VTPSICIYHRAFICNVLNGRSGDKTLIDFGFTRSKGKVTGVIFVKKCKRGVCSFVFQSFYISHADWSW